MSEKRLGKIKSIKFGHTGYQECMMGLHIDIGGDGWGVGTGIYGGWWTKIEVNERTTWNENDRNKQRADLVKQIDELLQKAKVDDITKLKGIPVECEFEGMTLKDWRVLEEVL